MLKSQRFWHSVPDCNSRYIGRRARGRGDRTIARPDASVDDSARTASPLALHGERGTGSVLLVCEHASNHVPAHYGSLGLSSADLERHIAWDLGALDLAFECARTLDAPLAYATVSRLVLDLNRAVDAPDSIVELSEDTPIPGNHALGEAQRRARQREVYAPFHDGLAALLDARLAQGRVEAVVSIHSFTPSYLGVARPWPVGVLSHRDRRLADALLAELRRDALDPVGDNEPYSPRDGVYHTLDRHAESRGIPCAMIEVRNDGLADADGRRAWARRLCDALQAAIAQLPQAGAATPAIPEPRPVSARSTP